MKKYQNKAILAVVLIVGLISLSYISLTFTDGDEGRYLYLAKAIADGHGQTNIHLPSPVPEGLTPPGYPYLLSLFAHGEHLPMFWPKALSWLAYLAYSLIITLIFKQLFNSEVCIFPLLSLLVLLPVSILIYTWTIFAETTFLFLSSLALLAVLRGKGNIKEGVVTGLFIAASMAIRPVGIAMIPAIGLHYLWRKKWIPLMACAITFILAYSPVIILTFKALGVPFGHISHYASEGDPFGAVLQLLHTEAIILPHYIFKSLPHMLYFSLFDENCLLEKINLSFLIMPGSIALASLMLVGFTTRIKQLHFFDLYALVYLPMVSSYHIALQRGIEDRYLLPLLPHAVYYIYLGLNFLLTRVVFKKTILKAFILLSLSYVLLTSVGAGFIRAKKEWAQRGLPPYAPDRHLSSPLESPQAFGRYLEACEWIKENTPESALIVSRKPRHTFLISERKGFRLLEVREQDETPINTISRFKESGPIYVLQDAYPMDSSYGQDRMHSIDPMLKLYAKQFIQVYSTQSPRTIVWELK